MAVRSTHAAPEKLNISSKKKTENGENGENGENADSKPKTRHKQSYFVL